MQQGLHRAWRELLKNPAAAAAAVLEERSSRAAALRQNSPFVATVRKFQSLVHAAGTHPDSAQRSKESLDHTGNSWWWGAWRFWDLKKSPLKGCPCLDKIDGRSQFSADYPSDDDKRRIRNGIAAHRAAMRNSGGLRMELLETLRSRPDVRIAALIDDDYMYSGPVLFSLDDGIVQEVERRVVVIHDGSNWERLLEVGETCTIIYRDEMALLEPGKL